MGDARVLELLFKSGGLYKSTCPPNDTGMNLLFNTLVVLNESINGSLKPSSYGQGFGSGSYMHTSDSCGKYCVSISAGIMMSSFFGFNRDIGPILEFR